MLSVTYQRIWWWCWLIFYFVVKSDEGIPYLYSAQCLISDSKLYAIGGLIKDDEQEYNREVFTLDLKLPFEVGKAKWNTNNHDYFAPAPGHATVALVEDNTTNGHEFILYGGLSLPDNQTFWRYTPSTNWWSFDRESSEQLRVLVDGSQVQVQNEFFHSLVVSTLKPYQLLSFGGIVQLDNDSLLHYPFVGIYDTRQKQWQQSDSLGPYLFGHTATVVNHIMYVLGGVQSNASSTMIETYKSILRFPLAKLDIVYAYDINEDSWRPIHTRGQIPLPRFGHSTISFRNYLIVAGGTSQMGRLYYLEGIYILDLNTLMWKRMDELYQELAYLGARVGGCAYIYENHLFYSLGLQQSAYLNQSYPSTQIIDLATFRATSHYIPNQPVSWKTIAIAVGSTLLALLVAFIIACWYFLRRTRISSSTSSYSSNSSCHTVQYMFGPLWSNPEPMFNALNKQANPVLHHDLSSFVHTSFHPQTLDQSLSIPLPSYSASTK